MNDSLFIFFTIFITTGLIYFMYMLMLGSKKETTDSELQITSKELLEQLRILYSQKKYNIVESLAKKYLMKKGNDDGIRTIFAKSLHNSGRVYEAIEQAQIIVKHQPSNFDMQIFLANCYLETGNPRNAINIFKGILEEDSNHVVALKELAQVYFKTNQKKSALNMYENLEEFLDSNQEKAKNKILIAEIHAEFREFDLAIKKYEQILDVYPEDINIKKRLIELYKENLDNDLGIELATEIVRTCSDDENSLWAIKTIMDIYLSMQNYEQALEYANLIKIHPLANPIQSEENIAQILFDEGKIEDSIELLNSLIVKDSQNIKLKKSLAKAHEENKNFKTAVDIYKEILDMANAGDIKGIHFEMSNIYANWAMHLFSQNDSETSFKYFTIALKYSPQNPDIYYQLGTVNKLIKNFNEAIIQFKKAIELDSQNAQYYYAISECYEEIDSVYEQQKALTESLKFNPDSAKANYKLGIIYEIQKDQNNAILYVKKAVNLDENFIDAKHKLALMLEHIGDRESATKLYEDILRIEPENEEILNNLKMLV